MAQVCSPGTGGGWGAEMWSCPGPEKKNENRWQRCCLAFPAMHPAIINQQVFNLASWTVLKESTAWGQPEANRGQSKGMMLSNLTCQTHKSSYACLFSRPQSWPQTNAGCVFQSLLRNPIPAPQSTVLPPGHPIAKVRAPKRQGKAVRTDTGGRKHHLETSLTGKSESD